MEKFIYYSGQRDWTSDDYDYLNSFLNKIFLYRDKDVNKYRISHMNLAAMENTTKAIIKAILMQQEILDEVVRENDNMKDILEVKPLSEKLYLQADPCHLFDSYEKMNIMM